MREARPQNLEVTALPNPADVVITPCEVNELHGTGTLLFRIFRDWSSIVSLRTTDFYDIPQNFGAVNFCVPISDHASQQEATSWLNWCLGKTSVRRVICIPYLPADLILAIAVKEQFNAPLCAYIMDDKNVCAEGISDELMKEFFAKSELRLVISPEMREAYERKYGMPFHVVPPLVSEEMIRTEPQPWKNGSSPRRGVLLGNIWGQRWLDWLRELLRDSGHQIDWYCNQKNPRELVFDRAEMEADGIRLLDPVPETALPEILSHYPYALVPSDTLDGQSSPSVEAIAELSLPSRIPTMMASAHLPILVVGHPRTAAAGFVKRFELGSVVPYERKAVLAAIDELLEPSTQSRVRNRAAALSAKFTARGSDEWIWRSLEAGEPCDLIYEELMPRIPGGV